MFSLASCTAPPAVEISYNCNWSLIQQASYDGLGVERNQKVPTTTPIIVVAIPKDKHQESTFMPEMTIPKSNSSIVFVAAWFVAVAAWDKWDAEKKTAGIR